MARDFQRLQEIARDCCQPATLATNFFRFNHIFVSNKLFDAEGYIIAYASR